MRQTSRSKARYFSNTALAVAEGDRVSQTRALHHQERAGSRRTRHINYLPFSEVTKWDLSAPQLELCTSTARSHHSLHNILLATQHFHRPNSALAAGTPTTSTFHSFLTVPKPSTAYATILAVGYFNTYHRPLFSGECCEISKA